MKINAIPVNHCIALTTVNSQYIIEKLKKPGRIRVHMIASCNLEYVLKHPWVIEPQIATYQGIVHPTYGRINGCELKKVGKCGAAWHCDCDYIDAITVTSEITNVSEEPVHISELQTLAKDGGSITLHPSARTFSRHLL